MPQNFGAGANEDDPPVELGDETPALDRLLDVGQVSTSRPAPLDDSLTAGSGPSGSASDSGLDRVDVPPAIELSADEQFLRDIGR